MSKVNNLYGRNNTTRMLRLGGFDTKQQSDPKYSRHLFFLVHSHGLTTYAQDHTQERYPYGQFAL